MVSLQKQACLFQIKPAFWLAEKLMHSQILNYSVLYEGIEGRYSRLCAFEYTWKKTTYMIFLISKIGIEINQRISLRFIY